MKFEESEHGYYKTERGIKDYWSIDPPVACDAKIMLLPKGEGTAISIPVTKEPEVIEGQKVVRPESSTIREKSQQPKTEETRKEELPHPEPFKFEFNP